MTPRGKLVCIGMIAATLALFPTLTNLCFRYMGSLTNNGRKLAHFAGFYKSIQSAGAAIVWRLDSLKKPFMGIFISAWVLLAGSLVCALPLVFFKIKDHTDIEEDLKFSDETLSDVAPKVNLSLEATNDQKI